MFIDTHAHIDYTSEKLNISEETLISDAKQKNVAQIITIGCNIESSNNAIRSARSNPGIIFSSIAIDPNNPEEYSQFDEIESLAHNNPDIVAIGETGLDYHWEPDSKKTQITLFLKHIELAKKLHKPVIIHCRDAYDDMLNIITDFPTVTFIMHSYNGSPNDTRNYLKNNSIYYGINGIVTFKSALLLQESVVRIPIEKIVLETDCPYLTPVPYRGKPNTPVYIPVIAQKIAEIKNMRMSDIEVQTTQNATELFSLRD